MCTPACDSPGHTAFSLFSLSLSLVNMHMHARLLNAWVLTSPPLLFSKGWCQRVRGSPQGPPAIPPSAQLGSDREAEGGKKTTITTKNKLKTKKNNVWRTARKTQCAQCPATHAALWDVALSLSPRHTEDNERTC